jgi:rubrerythrin
MRTLGRMDAYLDYFELTERKGWRLQDLPWDTPDLERVSDADRAAVVATSVIESGVPHYTKLWDMVDGFRSDWELAQFVTLWAGEEERHNVALNKLTRILGANPEAEYARVATHDFPRAQKASCPTRCYETIPGMLTYTVLQELVTWKFYSCAAKATKSRLVRETFRRIGEDEMRHHVWYRDALRARYESASDREWFASKIEDAVRHFSMPHSIFHLQEKFFDVDSDVVGKLGQLDIKMKAARALSFDKSLLARLMLARPDAVVPAGAEAAG